MYRVGSHVKAVSYVLEGVCGLATGQLEDDAVAAGVLREKLGDVVDLRLRGTPSGLRMWLVCRFWGWGGKWDVGWMVLLFQLWRSSSPPGYCAIGAPRKK